MSDTAMPSKGNRWKPVMRKGQIVVLDAIVCLCALLLVAMPGFGYTANDVKRGEDLVAAKDYKGAIRLLSDITSDYEFCSMNPANAARACLLLCDAYEANGEQKSDAYKTTSESMKATLIQVWATLKKQQPDVQKRLETVGEICSGHPQALAEFLKPTLQHIVAANTSVKESDYLATALRLYREALDAAPAYKAKPDMDLILQIGEYYFRLEEFKKAIAFYDDVLKTIPEEKLELRARALFVIVDTYMALNDFNGVITWGKQYVELPMNTMCKQEIRMAVVTCLERVGRKDEAVKMLESLVASDEPAEVRANFMAHLGDIQLSAKHYDDAAKLFKQVSSVTLASDDTKASAAYSMGLCCWERGYKSAAVRWMVSVSKQYATSNWATKARKQLYDWGEPAKS